MCGIAGYIARQPLSAERQSATLRALRHRGPDHAGTQSFTSSGWYISLLHTRLSILDLDPRSHQPFSLHGHHLIFNGEIYNYRELRETLREQGDTFVTDSDTEVLLRAFLRYGSACEDHFEGMWAFVIFNERDGSLYASRDRFGEKTIYYHRSNDCLVFASEVKGLEALLGHRLRPNEEQLKRYLTLGYRSLYQTSERYFHQLEEFPASHHAAWFPGEAPQPRPYWTLRYQPRDWQESDAIEAVAEKLTRSLRLRLRADVPLAFCLSGGIDSTSLVSLASKHLGHSVKAFSIIDSDERYNELDGVQATVDDLGIANHTVHLRPSSQLDRLQRLVQAHDAPVATISFLIHDFLVEAIAAEGYKVTIAGFAADEIFTGYYDHYLLQIADLQKCGDPFSAERLREWEQHILPVTRNPYFRDPSLFGDPARLAVARSRMYYDYAELAPFLYPMDEPVFPEESLTDSPLRNRMLNQIRSETVPVMLREEDLNAMAHSLENRNPFLDRELAELLFSIPSRLLIKDGYNKYLLRAAMQGVLNDRVRLNRQKKGFNASITSLFDLNDPELREVLLADSMVWRWVRKDAVAACLDQPQFPNTLNRLLFSILNVQLFLARS